MKILGIQVDGGYYLSASNKFDHYNELYGSNGLNGCKVNGLDVEATFSKLWVFCKEEPKEITKIVKHNNINKRYELKNKSLESCDIPLVLSEDDVMLDDDYDWTKYCDYRSLYEMKSDSVADTEEMQEFEFELIAETKKINKPTVLGKVESKQQYSSDIIELTTAAAKAQVIDRITFPPLLYQNLPCELSSHDTYRLVRQHIKENINPKVAEITSDYDFCFTVQKKIPLAENQKYTVDVNFNLFAKRKKKPKYETRYREDRSVEIFEMTHSERGYQGYTVISGIRAEDHDDLKLKIDKYLSDLMEFINRPVQDCPNCKGCGVIFDKAIPVVSK